MSYLTTVGAAVQLIPPPIWLAHLSRFPIQPIKKKKGGKEKKKIKFPEKKVTHSTEIQFLLSCSKEKTLCLY